MSDKRSVALVYVRKSFVKTGQSDPASPELQSRAATERAEALGLAVEQHADAEGHRSGKTGKRPGWQAITHRLGDPDVGALIVYSHDRAWRNLKELLNTADECVERGVKFILVKDGVDVSTAQGRFLLSLLGSFAEFESNITGERRAAAVDWVRREHGQHMGLAPFGTERQTIDGHLRLIPSTQPQPNGSDYAALKHVYEIYAAGQKGYTLLVEQLNREGWGFRSVTVVVNPDGTRSSAPKPLRPWTYSDVNRLLHNHWLYAGWIVRGRGGNGREFELIPGNHGPVLPTALTEAVATRLAGHKHGWRMPRNLSFGLSGLVWCVCGVQLTGLEIKGRRYYRHARKCEAGQAFAYWAPDLEAEVRTRIEKLDPPPATSDQADRALDGSFGGQDAARSHLEDSLARAKELYIDGDLSRTAYQARRQELETALSELVRDEIEPGETGMALSVKVKHVGEFTPAEFQATARGLYQRITISGETRCFFLDYQPQAWCAAWA